MRIRYQCLSSLEEERGKELTDKQNMIKLAKRLISSIEAEAVRHPDKDMRQAGTYPFFATGLTFLSENRIWNSEFLIFYLETVMHACIMGMVARLKAPLTFGFMLKRRGYSDKAIREIWKWYDFYRRKGVNF